MKGEGRLTTSVRVKKKCRKDEKAIVDALFDIGMEHDVIFSPLFASSEEWNNGLFKDFPIYGEITREGAVVG